MSERGSRPHPAVWLVYLIFVIMGPLATGHSRGLWMTAIAIAAFLPVYFWCTRRTGWPVAGGLLIITALGVVMTPVNFGGATFFTYVAALSPRLGTSRRAIATILAMVAIEAALAPLVPIGVYYLLPAAMVTLLVGFVCLHDERIEMKNAELRRSREEITRLAQIAERERIARDLHDLLGHTLSVVVLKSELTAKLVERGDARAAREAREIEAIARQALREVRAAVSGFRAAGLAAELNMAAQACAAADVDLEREVDEGSLPPLVEGVLAMTLREAITNVVRHAQARTCRLEIVRGGSSVGLRVQDDGRGLAGAPGSGMKGIRERVAALGGEVAWEAGPGGRGTLLRVTLPLRGEVDYQALGAPATADAA